MKERTHENVDLASLDHLFSLLAVHVLNSLGEMREVTMGDGTTRDGWTVSQVERLIGLPRRDVQRACYQDRARGGAAILNPADGSWGRRTYHVDDLAALYLVKLYKDQGLSLAEIREVFASQGSRASRKDLLSTQVERLREQRDELSAKLRMSEALLGAIDAALDPRALRSVAKRALAACMAEIAHRDILSGCECPSNTPDIERVLNEPGMDLVVELWLGSGSYERMLSELFGTE